MEEQIVEDRITEREGPHLMAGRLGVPRSTIYRVLRRRGLSRLSDLDRTTATPIRYVRDCPGELVHVDIKKLGRIPHGGGWRVLGQQEAGPKQRVGYEYVHSMVDDHSRMAYSEVLDSQDAHACAQFMLRAARWFATWGYRIDRPMTDNAMAYRRSRAFADALAQIGAVHKLIRPYRPQTNGKVERFHQTLLGGWAYKRPYTTNQQRRQALTRLLGLNYCPSLRPTLAGLIGPPQPDVRLEAACAVGQLLVTDPSTLINLLAWELAKKDGTLLPEGLIAGMYQRQGPLSALGIEIAQHFTQHPSASIRKDAQGLLS